MLEKDRVFSEAELADAGRLTVDLIAECLQRQQRDEAANLLKRFQQELMTMFFSYTGWETNILRCITELGDEAAAESARVSIENYDIAPERKLDTSGVAQRWNNELEAIIDALGDADAQGLAERARSLREEALALHDGLMSRVVGLLTIVYEDYGEDSLSWVFSQVMRPEAMDPDGKIPFREKVENIMLFTRCHMMPFTVTEDEEKVTFMPPVCASGARLIRGGHYDEPRSNAIVRGGGPLTYGREEMPIYCCHEPSMEHSSILRTGVPLFLVDPPEDVGISPCKVYVYKNPANIPSRFFERLGLSKPDDLIASTAPS